MAHGGGQGREVAQHPWPLGAMFANWAGRRESKRRLAIASTASRIAREASAMALADQLPTPSLIRGIYSGRVGA